MTKLMKAHGFLRVASTASIVLFWIFGLTVPIYTDEISYRYYEARQFIEGSFSLTTFPQCPESRLVPTPLIFAPTRIFEAIQYMSGNPLLIRIIGLLNATVFIGLFAIFASQRSKLSSPYVLIFIWTGMLPFLLLLNRPEQRILICLLLFICLALSERNLSLILRTSLWALVLPYMFMFHGKALFLMPVLVAAGWYIFKSMATRLCAGLWLGVVAASSYVYWGAKVACDSNPSMQQLLQSLMLQPSKIADDPTSAMKLLFSNFTRAPEYFKQLLFLGHDYSFWLPKTETPTILSNLANLTLIAVFSVGFAILLTGSYKSIRMVFLEKRATLLFALLVSAIGFCAFQTSKAHYDGFYFYGLFSICVVLAASYLQPRERIQRKVLYLGLSTSFISIATILGMYHSFMLGPWIKETELKGQEYAFSAYSYREARGQIQTLAQQCGINPSKEARRIVVDDITYSALMNYSEPINWLFVQGYWGRGIPNTWQFLERERSSGVVIKCSSLGAETVGLAIRSGIFCCLSSQAIHQLAEKAVPN